MDTDKIKIFGARVRVDATGKLAELERAERDKMKAKVEKIKAHGINCFINRQLIYNWPEQLLADAGIASIEHADFEGVERLALVTGGEIASTFDHPELVKLGHCDLIEEVMIGEDKVRKRQWSWASFVLTDGLRGSSSNSLALLLVKLALSYSVVQPSNCWMKRNGPFTMHSQSCRRP